jgi:hypothetical protein
MVFWSWRVFGWRWWTTKREFFPQVTAGLLFVGFALGPLKFARGRFDSLPGFSHDNFTETYERKNQVLDDDRIRILAQRRYENLKKRAEAKAYFHVHGYQPQATNLHFKYSEINSI